jgi:hypothetical protein
MHPGVYVEIIKEDGSACYVSRALLEIVVCRFVKNFGEEVIGREGHDCSARMSSSEPGNIVT